MTAPRTVMVGVSHSCMGIGNDTLSVMVMMVLVWLVAVDGLLVVVVYPPSCVAMAV